MAAEPSTSILHDDLLQARRRILQLEEENTVLRNAAAGGVHSLIWSAAPVHERKQTEEALRKSEERYRLAEWATNDGLWDWNLATDDCYFSPRFKALLGFEDKEIENKATLVFGRMHPDDAPILFEALRLHLEERAPYQAEIRVRMKDGDYRWFRTRGQAVRDEADKPIRMAGSMTDIHNRKTAEAAANEHDHQLREMIDSIEQLAWMAQADGHIFWYNRRWYEYTGTTPVEMEGWGWQSVHHPKFLPNVLARWRHSIQTGEVLDMQFPLLGEDGVYRPFLTRVVPLRNSEGKVVRWFGTNTNVESLEREKNLLKESERKFRELAETLPELIWVADPNGQVNYYNPQWESYTGLSPTQGFGEGWRTIIHPADISRLSDCWLELLATGASYECEARVRKADGSYRWFLHRATAIHDEYGSVIKLLGTTTEIESQKRTEEALRKSNSDLEQFAYAASHDLQEPLRTVAIYSQMMVQKYGAASPDAERFAGYITSGTKKMAELLHGILAYSRADAELEEDVTCNSEAALNSALLNLRQAISESGAVVTHDDLPAVGYPAIHLVQVFQNLIGNAIKYRADDRPPIINVSAVEQSGWHKFAVSDNGVGIRAEYSERIFGMFKRLHRDKDGVGIGLPICKRIVERHGGHIWLESTEGEGSTFYFTVPKILPTEEPGK